MPPLELVSRLQVLPLLPSCLPSVLRFQSIATGFGTQDPACCVCDEYMIYRYTVNRSTYPVTHTHTSLLIIDNVRPKKRPASQHSFTVFETLPASFRGVKQKTLDCCFFLPNFCNVKLQQGKHRKTGCSKKLPPNRRKYLPDFHILTSKHWMMRGRLEVNH